MQEKRCPICGEKYYKFIDYCFRDGAKLVFPGEEAEVEDTELLSQVHKIQYNEAVKPNQIDEDATNTFGLNIAKPSVEEAAEVIDEDLEGPMALGNTQMLRKEDLLAMFHDDSTYNGELVDPDEETATFDAAETEEMEATETFDLTNRNHDEKTEFEQSAVPLPIRDDSTPVVQPVQQEERVESIPISTPAPPKPAPMQQEHYESEKEPSVSPLLLMGGLLGLVFVIVGFFFFYQNQNNKTQVIVPPPQKKEPVKQIEPELPKKQEPVEVPPEVEEVEEPKEETGVVEDNEKEVVEEGAEPNPQTEKENTEEVLKTIQLGVKIGPFNVKPLEIPENISEKSLIEKLEELGISFGGEPVQVTFVNAQGKEEVVEFPLTKDETVLELIIWQEE